VNRVIVFEIHGPEFQKRELSAVLADSGLTEQDGALRSQLDDQRDDNQERRRENKRKKTARNVHRSFH
jgi:hypothetical protein